VALQFASPSSQQFLLCFLQGFIPPGWRARGIASPAGVLSSSSSSPLTSHDGNSLQALGGNQQDKEKKRGGGRLGMLVISQVNVYVAIFISF